MIDSRPTLTVLALLSCAYLLAFIPPNLTGAKDPNMLGAFRQELPEYGSDEATQFGTLTRMTRFEASPYKTLKNMLFYNQYFYGYTFFLSSMVVILPLRLIEHFFETSIPTSFYMMVLRQLSPIFMVTAILLLVYLWTGFRSVARSVLLFIFLGSIPAVFLNNMFWHPDSLVTLFVVLTIFSLAKDELRFGRWFYLAAASSGLATGTKVIGLFFFLSVGVCLLLGFVHRRLDLKLVFKHGVLFVAVMAAAIVFSNPLLLLPSEAKAYYKVQSFVAERNAWGWDRARDTGPMSWYLESGAGGAPALRESFGFWWIYLLALLSSLFGVVYNRDKRIVYVIILTWILPISIYMLYFVGSKGARYFIPVLLPFFSCIGATSGWRFDRRRGPQNRSTFIIGAASVVLCALQFAYYIPRDIGWYTRVLERESRSSSLHFYWELRDRFLSSLPSDKRLTVARDWKVYVPPSSNLLDNGTGNFDYDYVNVIKPDVILLTKGEIDLRSDPGAVQNSFPADREQLLKSYDFYRNAKSNSIVGFNKLFETDFAVAFVGTKNEVRGPNH